MYYELPYTPTPPLPLPQLHGVETMYLLKHNSQGWSRATSVCNMITVILQRRITSDAADTKAPFTLVRHSTVDDCRDTRKWSDDYRTRTRCMHVIILICSAVIVSNRKADSSLTSAMSGLGSVISSLCRQPHLWHPPDADKDGRSCILGRWSMRQNAIPADILHAPSLDTFKKHLKSRLFSVAYNL